jgi:flagellar hook-associated protein 1 FlgK
MDQRQLAIDRISEIVPVRTMPRDRDAVALISTGGAILLDGTSAEIGFIRSNEIAPHMTLENGQLSQLTMNGRIVNSDSDGPMSGGKLGAQLTIRDVAAVDVQSRLDALALDLASGFGPGGPDTTLSSGDSGLFTDFGAPVTSAGETGLSQRLKLNELVNPGAEIWRLRDGLGASVTGPVGDATLLNSLQTQLTIPTDPASSYLPDTRQTIFTRFAEVTSWISDARVDADHQAVFSMSQSTALSEMQLAQGVDTDVELEWLMRIEQAYAANAKVLGVVDELMQRILAI